MVRKSASPLLLAIVFSYVCVGVVDAQVQLVRVHTGIDQVPGAEFNSAVNLTNKNVKAFGTIFIPDATRHVGVVLVLVERGPNSPLAAQARFGDPGWRRFAQTCTCALLYVRLDTIRAVDANISAAGDVLRNASVGGAKALLSLLDHLGRESGRASGVLGMVICGELWHDVRRTVSRARRRVCAVSHAPSRITGGHSGPEKDTRAPDRWRQG
jgi:hypothetical protein